MGYIVDKEKNNAYKKVIIDSTKILRQHSSAALYLPNNIVAIDSLTPGVEKFFVLNPKIEVPYYYLYAFTPLEAISPVNSAFKVTMSEITSGVDKEHEFNYIQVKAIKKTKDSEEELSCQIPILLDLMRRNEFYKQCYRDVRAMVVSGEIDENSVEDVSNLEQWNMNLFLNINDLPDSEYTDFTDEERELMDNKKMLSLRVGDRNGFAVISYPLLGDTKKCFDLKYRLVRDDTSTFTLEFKQVYDIGTLYTTARFMYYNNVNLSNASTIG